LIVVLNLWVVAAHAQAPKPPQLANAQTVLGTTYCVDQDFLPTLSSKIAEIRGIVRAARGQGQITGYISVPLSATGGGATDINQAVSAHVKQRLEALYGGKVWMLAPGSQEASIPQVNGKSAGGQEYMYMWTQVLAGENGRGPDFDLFYFVGPTDFWDYLAIKPENGIAMLESLADQRGLTGDKKRNFVTYYAFRASASASRGAHDEWNILRLLNDARRSDPNFGIGVQIASLFDGRPVELDDTESVVSSGYEGRCNP